MPHLPYDLLLPSQQFHNLKQLGSTVLLSVPTESQLREGRNFSTFQSLLHPQCPAPWLAHSRCSITISKKAGRKKRRHKKDGGASGPSPSIHTEAQNLFLCQPCTLKVYIRNRNDSKSTVHSVGGFALLMTAVYQSLEPSDSRQACKKYLLKQGKAEQLTDRRNE